MSEFKINEAAVAQFPMIRHAAEIGWTPVAPHEATRRRGGNAGLLFRETLREKLAAFNPWMSPDAVTRVIETLEALPASIEGNREALAWLRGAKQIHDPVEKRARSVTLVDFDRPTANDFCVTWEWRMNPPARKGNRADAVFLVNGVPVAVVEHKNPTDGGAIERGLKQLRRYEIETPELLGLPQLFNVTHMLDYWYGVTWNVNRRTIFRWKQPPDETYRFAVQAFFEPTDFLRTLQQWILFFDKDGETKKSVLREHQRTAVTKVVERCADSTRKRGLIWHTQGSGKTFTLLTAARQILEDKERFRNATVLLVVDRTELEGQLSGWVNRLLGEMQEQDILVSRASSKTDLADMLAADRRGLIVAMIHKFEGLPKNAVTRDNVYVFIDEAHRSVARELGTYLMAAAPNATIVGFTGTPIDRTAHGQGTFKIFGGGDPGGYLDKYSIRESIADETTVPIRHTMAPSDMTVPAERLDQEFLELAEAEGVADVEELNRILDRNVGLRTFLAADDRIAKVAAFAAQHYREKVLPLGYKAMLVAVNREACAKYKQELDRHLPTEWSVPIYTDNVNDVVDRPLVAEWQQSPAREEHVRKLFVKPTEDPKILIVTDKLLTGFDAPILGCMYLDKPMRDHVLLQAIARVNRPYADDAGVSKRVGLVVDFVGVLRELRKALAFDSADLGGALEDLDLLLADLLRKLADAKASYLDSKGTGTEDAESEKFVYGRLRDEEPRRRFFDDYKEIEALWEIVSPAPELRDWIEPYRTLAKFYAEVRVALNPTKTPGSDLGYKTKRLIETGAKQDGLGRLTKSITFDVKTIEGLQADGQTDDAKVFNLVRGLREEIDGQPELAPALRLLQERAERILKEFERRNVTGLAAMDQLAALAREKERAAADARASGLSPAGCGVLLALRDEPTMTAAGLPAEQVANEADAALARFPHAADNQEERRQLRLALYRATNALDDDAQTSVVDKVLAILLREDER